MGALVSGTTLLVGLVLFQFGMEPLLKRLAESQFTEAAARIKADLDSVFQPTEHLLNMSRRWIYNAPPPPGSADAFNRLFMPVLDTLPQATSIVAGTSEGEGWMVMQRTEGGWRNRITDPARWGDQHLFIDHEADGSGRQHRQTLKYDPRLRDWYKLAEKQP